MWMFTLWACAWACDISITNRQENWSRCLRISTFLPTCCPRHRVQTSEHRQFECCIQGRFAATGEVHVLLRNARFIGEMHVSLEKHEMRVFMQICVRGFSNNKEMHVWSKNACFIAKCPIRREIIVHIS